MSAHGEFAGTDRFAIVRRVGAGGMGIVYEAWDREREMTVAVKCLRQVDPLSLFLFKREFRSLADVTHPNLVVLHELESVDEDWFFSMEYVDGADFLTWVRDGDDGRIALEDASAETVISNAETAVSTKVDGGRDAEAFITAAAPRPPSVAQIRRLREGLRQLCEGVAALHAAGKLHRDIKPSNALVTREGRVVVLDFGLVADVENTDPSRHVVGTPAYMAPEQGAGASPSRAADWYSVGVVLYECLTGRLPFVGSQLEILLDKQRHGPPPPHQIVDGVPEDLDRLCAALLQPDPERRPGEREILRMVGSAHADGVELYSHRSSPSLGVGRDRELAELASAFAAAQRGRTVTAHVRGPSGMGKTSLVRRFLDDLRRERRAEILIGRCYERESVPYKALDPVIDDLSRLLSALPYEEVARILPRDVKAAARMFPALSRVEVIAEAPEVGEIADLHQLRRRATEALRRLLAGMSDLGRSTHATVSGPASKRPLVIHIDDLHWSDADSALLLGELLGGDRGGPILLVVAYRSGAELPPDLLPTVGEQRYIDVAPLPPNDARELAERLLGSDGGGNGHAGSDGALAGSIAAEAGGNPLFVAELVRAHQEGGAAGNDLEAVLAARIARLPAEARLLLELVAVASGPVPRGALRRASRLGRAEYTAAAILATGRLIRSSGARDTDALDVYHDSIRRAVLTRLDAASRIAHHRALAAALATADGDPERLVFHHRGAGDLDAAIRYAEQAAARADEALAFDRAAELYRLCLELGAVASAAPRAGPAPAAVRNLRVQLAEALVNAGRSRDAADELMRAAQGAPAWQVRELKRRAMEQYLRSGHLDQAMVLMREVLDLVDLRLPATPVRALPSLLVKRAQLRVRGLRWQRRDEEEIAPDELTRVDVAWSVANLLGMIDTIRGADFQARHLLLALATGEPKRVARALATEASYSAASGHAGMRRAEQVIAEGRRALAGIDDPRTRANLIAAEGLAVFLDGRWREALGMLDVADAEYTERCRGLIWELNTVRTFALWCLGYLGRMNELAARSEAYRRDARERGDRYAMAGLIGAMPNLAWLTQDDVAGARSFMAEAMRQWPSHGFFMQHFNELIAEANADLYEGNGSVAWARVAAAWPALQRSLLPQIQQIRMEGTFCRARAGIAAAAGGGDRKLLDLVLADADKLAGEDARRGPILADFVRAGVQLVRGRRGEAAALLDGLAPRLESVDMTLYAAIARRGAGLATGRTERVAEQDAWLREQGVRNPDRLCAVFLATPPAGRGGGPGAP